MPLPPARQNARFALMRYHERDLAGAEALASASLALDPSSASTWTLRGRIRRDAGNPDAAWNDFTQALKLDPASWHARMSRACLAFDAGLPKDALADFEQALADRRDAPEDYNRFRIWLCRAKLGEERAASRELRTWLRGNACASPWTWAIAETLWGEKKPAALLAEAAHEAQRCEAGFWAGERLLLSHDRPAAVKALRQAAASPLWRFTEKRSAEAELRRLGK